MPFTKREKQEDETIIFTFLNIYVYCIHNMHTAQHASNMYFRGNGETFCHQLKRVEREYEKIAKKCKLTEAGEMRKRAFLRTCS